jgi:alpha-ketoglutarate-dependent taurine dioxygenase
MDPNLSAQVSAYFAYPILSQSVTPLFESFGAIVTPSSGKPELSSLEENDIENLSAQYGVLLMRDFSVDDQTFRRFTDNLMPFAFAHGAKTRKAVSQDGTVVEVVKGNAGMVLHKELGYVPWSPEWVWFFCKRPADADGETTLADGRQVARALPESALKLLTRQRIKYTHSRIVPVPVEIGEAGASG